MPPALGVQQLGDFLHNHTVVFSKERSRNSPAQLGFHRTLPGAPWVGLTSGHVPCEGRCAGHLEED
jgi:hypothetical protein